MEWIEKINSENFDSSFNVKDVLNNSVYYPASGIDGRGIEGLSMYSCSFIHADYSMPQETVNTALRADFIPVGYNLVGLRDILEDELTPNGFISHNLPLNEHEQNRIHFLQHSIRNFTPFALWAVYELDYNETKNITAKINKFSILHVGGEACATFDALYIGYKINPLAVVILNPGEGYGDNWTIFRDSNYRFYKLIEYNVQNNHQRFPRYLFTNTTRNCFWPNYQLINRNNILGCDTYENG